MNRLILFGILLLVGCNEIPKDLVPLYINETVVMVNGSSGVVIYSNDNKTIVLTADHVVNNVTNTLDCSGCYYNKIDVSFPYIEKNDNFIEQKKVRMEVFNLEFDKKSDLAILELRPGAPLISAKLATYNPELGENIWLASNPNSKIQSIKRGIISSKFRQFKNIIVWEVSGQVIFGSSGGGAFNEGGQLIGTIQSVSMFDSNQCFDLYDWDSDKVENFCVQFPLTDMGFIVPLAVIRRFLLSSSYANDFKYLE